ncbi:MAG: outer membrane beta-barrel protein [Smithella sp.]
MKKTIFFMIFTFFSFFFITVSMSGAQENPGEKPSGRFEFHPSITLEEKYTSNANFTATDKKDDFITRIIPGIALSKNSATFGVDLGAHLTYNWYANNSDYNYTGYDGNIALRYNPYQNLTFQIRDSVIQSENPRYLDLSSTSTTPQYLGFVQQGRSLYLMNRLEPSVNWQFARDGNIGFTYINNIYHTDNPTINESTINTYRPNFSYWFNQYNGILLDYSYTEEDNTINSDMTGHVYHGRYIYKFNPRSSIYADYSFIKRDFDFPATSYDIHSPAIGIEHAFNESLTGLLQAGYYYVNPSDGNNGSDSGFSGILKLTQKDRVTTYSIILETGYREIFGAGQQQNQSFARSYNATATVDHMLSEKFKIGLIASVTEMDYIYSDRNDRIYSAELNASYQITRWLSFFARTGYWWDDSTFYTTGKYDEFHVIVGLTAIYL